MKILFNPVNFNHNIRHQNNHKLKPLPCDTVAFTAMKKSQFSGIDLATINKFQAPIEKFNSNKDLQNWCEDKVRKIVMTQFKGKNDDIKYQRKEILNQWYDYLVKKESIYNNTAKLLILDGITSSLKPDNSKIPPVLNKEVLKNTIDEMENIINSSPKENPSFKNLYLLNLQRQYFNNDGGLDDDYTGWVTIPSIDHDCENFENNLNKLRALSYKTWCTKGVKGDLFLRQGDFHIYFEEGKPKIGIRFLKNEVQEIQGIKNDSKIPVKFLENIIEHIKDYPVFDMANNELHEAKCMQGNIEKFENELKTKGADLKMASVSQILEASGIKVYEDDDGLLIIDEYRQPDKYSCTYEDMGIDEDKLLQKIKRIEGKAIFAKSNAKSLGSVEYIGGDIQLNYSDIQDSGKLKYIGGNVVLNQYLDKDYFDLIAEGMVYDY